MVPVLLVHGIDDTSARFRKMRAVLQAYGFDPVDALDIIPCDASIPFAAMADQVRDRVGLLRHETGAQKVDIVAYSMGTLAVRYFLQRLGGQFLVRRFISLAGPHHGTLTAYLRQNVGCRQMRPSSHFLQDLNADGDKWGDVEVHSFWTPLDLMVLPAVSSVLDQAQNRAFYVPVHSLMTSDSHVIEAVAQTLAATD